MRSILLPDVNVLIEIADLASCQVRRISARNRVVLAGRNRLRDLLAGDAVAAAISHVGLGTGTTPVADTDTVLGNEVYRDVPTQLLRTDGKLTVKLYVPSTAANGYTLSEAGLWIGGTSALGSGLLFARVVFAGEVKTSAQAWTVTWEVNFNAG